MYKITDTITWDIQDMHDNLLYAGNTSYSWYRDAYYDADNNLVFVLDDPEDPDEGKTFTLAPWEVVATIRRILAEDNLYAVGGQKISEQILDEDIDADGADCIVQVACFGETVYS